MKAPSVDLLAEVASLIGERVQLLHAPAMEEADAGLSGRDVDCAVTGLDLNWPLRLTGGWRLCQYLQYDLGGWFWGIEKDGLVLGLDTIEDPLGLGRDGIRTNVTPSSDGAEALAPVRAAYLATKRLRKGQFQESEWERIGRLARGDPFLFQSALEAMAGSKLGEFLHASALQGRPPDKRTWRLARSLQVLRRFATPERALIAMFLGARREVNRIFRPTGLFVVVSGPDGSGKTTLANTLPDLCEGLFRRSSTIHWRPGLLPRLGALIGREEADPTKPHSQPLHGRIVSLLSLSYYWLDFLLGGLVRIWPTRMRTGLVVMERGWWDIAVDSRRYRLDVPNWLVRGLGLLLPRPDIFLLLQASPESLLDRKTELPKDELVRQMATWRRVLPAGATHSFIDAAEPLGTVAARARNEILSFLEARSISRLGAGWFNLPRRFSGWTLPRGSPSAARNGLMVYHPVTIRGRIGWEAARLAAGVGGFRFLPRGAAPPRRVREILAPYLPARSTLAVTEANHPGRYVALILDDHGLCRAVAKVAIDGNGALALDREAKSIRAMTSLLPSSLSAPTIMAQDQGLLLLEWIPWRARLRPWRLDEEVAWALGYFFQKRSVERSGEHLGSAHGDCAPWNLLRTADSWILVDWENASSDAPPLHDVCHYVVQAYSLLGRPSRESVIRGFRWGHGWIGAAIRAYCEGAGLRAADAEGHLAAYLRISHPRLHPRSAHERLGVRARLHLLSDLGK